MNTQPFPEEDRQRIADGYADERDAEHRRPLGLYTAAMEELRAAGRSAATTVRGQCDLVVPPGKAGSRLEVGAHLLRGLPLSGGEAMSELAAERAPELVAALRPALRASCWRRPSHSTADRSDYQSTALAARYLHAYIDTVSSGTFTYGQELAEHAFTDARTGTADVIAARVEDFVRATRSPDVTDMVMSREGGDDPGYRIHFPSEVKNGFARLFAQDRPDQVVTAENSDALDNPPALQRVFNAAVAQNAHALSEAFASEHGDPTAVMDRGAGFLVYLTESANLGLADLADEKDAYNEYLKDVVNPGAGLLPVDKIPVVGKPADGAYGLATDAILDQLFDTGHSLRQQTNAADTGRLVRELLDDQAAIAVTEAGAWQPGKDPVALAERDGLTGTESFIRDGELMPLEEIYASDRRTNRFFNYFLRADDGAAGAIQELTDQVQEAVGSATREAQDDFRAGGGDG